MFDINTAINTAIATAVAEAIAPLVERINALETKLTAAELFTKPINVTVPVDEAKMVEALNSQEWFWEKLSGFITNNSAVTVDDLHGFKQRLADAEDRLDKITIASDERVQEIVDKAIEQHCETYDHDEYDNVVSEWGGENANDFVKDNDLRGVVQDIVNDASFEVTVRL